MDAFLIYNFILGRELDLIWIWKLVASLHKDITATMCAHLRACDQAQLASECRYRSC